jgi:hypothetical protein
MMLSRAERGIEKVIRKKVRVMFKKDGHKMRLQELTTYLQTLCHEGHSNDIIMARLGDMELPLTDISIEKLNGERHLIVMEVEE